MKRILILCLGILTLALFPFIIQACASNQEELTQLKEQNKLLKELAGPLPASLDNFFPPKAQGPVWLLEMFALESYFSGTMTDVQQGDSASKISTNFKAFKTQYQKMSDMVPEWKNLFPMKPVDDLGAVLDSGDMAKIGPAFGAVGEVCSNCHVRNLVKAHQKYHWPSFDTVSIANPLGGTALGWKDYMLQMSLAFGGIGNDLKQGQLGNARKSYQAFSALFKGLPQGCNACHATPRTYFVDASVQALVDEMGKALDAPVTEAKKVEELSGAIGNESCMKCHLVHFPAPDTKARWEKFADLFK
ncbi:MAG: hypothetical protein HYX84_07125 [Chloroflexi bacterium]|nr:hypothetical protein [Chloroflexota bacterium]